MKFQRDYLINRVQEVIAAKQKAAEERNARAAAAHAEKLAAYVADTSDAWKQLADTIRARLRASRPLVPDDIPKPLRGAWNNGTWTTDAPRPHEADTAALEQLLLLLEAAVDEHVTTSALESMGFRTALLFA